MIRPRLREVPSRVPDVETLRKNIVVHEAGVDGEHAHEKNDVSTAGVDVSEGIDSIVLELTKRTGRGSGMHNN
jgi:hypothetical protein